MAVGCKTKEVASKVTIQKSDSTIVNKIAPVKSELIVKSLCDSITGKAKEFTNVIDNGITKTTIQSKDNTLLMSSSGDTTIVYKDRIVKEYVNKEVTNEKKVIPSWVWKALIVELLIIIVFIIFPKIPSFLNGIITKIFI